MGTFQQQRVLFSKSIVIYAGRKDMSVFAPSQKKRQQIQERHSLKTQLHIILLGMLMCVLLIVCAACEQYPATQENHPGTAPQITADPSASQLIYLVTFTAPTTYTQAHALLKELGLETRSEEHTSELQS